MNRELKFRAWDGTKLLHQEALYWNGENFVSGLWANCESYIEWDDQVEVDVMQYTGLKDRNGVEIYEGDLIQLYGNKNGSVQVIFKNAYVGGWAVTESYTCDGEWISLAARDPSEVEIIGNIYENHELQETL